MPTTHIYGRHAMWKTGSLALAVLLLQAWSIADSEARPRKRLDERTQMCRIFDGQLAWDSEPWGLGGQKFREVCKSCHTRDNDQGAPFLHAESYMPKHWNVIFTKRRVACAKNGAWDVLSEDEILALNDYLYRNGDWTYNPNDADSCG